MAVSTKKHFFTEIRDFEFYGNYEISSFMVVITLIIYETDAAPINNFKM